ncbi:MAG: AAA family ATPase [bacterium]|nr:AAA family ATPase [bacterium]
MSLIYVTGISGSGKSTVKAELVRRGYSALDVDEDNFKSWYNRKTDELAKEQKTWEEAEADRNWHEQHWLKIERSRVKKLHEVSMQSSSPVFLTGSTPNDKDILDLFDRVIFLQVSNKTLKHRILTRTNNSYGKHPDDLKDILIWNSTAEAQNINYGAVSIDAERPIGQVVNDILQLTT